MLAEKLHELESQLYNIHYDRKETLYFLKQGRPLLVTGVQCHNSSTGSAMLQDAIQVAKEFHGNVLEAPVYWYLLEPQQNVYDTSHVWELIHTVRKAGLHLVILWFATNKNGHPNYAPEYIKLDPDTYRLAVEPDGLPVPSLSPHCQATLRADQKAFVELMKCIKEEDGDCGTVLAVQVENEAGLGGTDRDYSQAAQRDFENGVPPELEGVEIPDSGASMRDNSWRGRFGRHANEAFTAWYQARYIEEIAAAGKQVYNIPMYVNAMLGHPYSEAGMAYNSGGPTVRVLDIWKKAAPSIDLLCPDIYMPCRDYYTHFCQAYSREDNALFIPESSFAGPSAALNVIRAAAQYEAVGVCCFGAESALDENGDLRKEVEDTAVSFQMVRNVAPLLLQYHGTGRIHAILQEEFMDQQLILTEGFRIVAHFDIRRRIPDTRETLPRGRGILVQTGEYEFYLTGDNVALDFVARPDPEEEMPRFWLACRQSNQLNFLTVEEGHFDEQNQWVVDFRRNGDETNYETYARKGEVVRIRLNPKMGKKGFVKA